MEERSRILNYELEFEMKLRKSLLFMALALVGCGVFGQQTVKGIVFEDENGNGKRDRKEKAIAGVGVSNGELVVSTDEQGRYSLPVSDDNIIFVIKPAAYTLPVNEQQLPQFFYRHKPQGSPDNFKYKGVEPTGPLPKSVDFALQPAKDDKEFTTLLFGDPQPYSEEEVDHYAKGIVAELEGGVNARFGLSLGDLVGDMLTLHDPYIRATQKIGIPWFNVMGNHDMNYEAKHDSLSDETFERNFGPANYSFNYGDVHFIILDDILYPDPRDGEGYWGGFRETQLRFIENDLKQVPKDKLIVLAFHIPLQSNGQSFNLDHRNRLFALLKDYPHTLSLSAHTHLQRQEFFTAKDGWMREKPHHEFNAGTTSGDWYSGALNEKQVPVSTMRDGTPKGYAFIHFKGNQYVIDYKVAGKPADYQIAIYAPKAINGARPGSAALYANFFMGYKDSHVEFRIDGGKWKKMNVEKNFDPNYIAALVNWDFSDTLPGKRRPSLPETSTHLWKAAFPRNLSKGEHQLEVRATDMFGRTFMAKQPFRVQ